MSDTPAALSRDDEADLRAPVEGHDGILVIRGGGNVRGWNGIRYRTGMSARNVGARQLSMNVATIPPGGVAHAHVHVGFEVMLFILQGHVRHEYGHGLAQVVDNEAGDFIYIEPGVPHEVFNASDTEPVVAVVARSDASEWENIVPYDRATARTLPAGADDAPFADRAMLKHELAVPDDARDGAPLVVLMHGRGSDRFDLLGLAPEIAPGAVVVTPEAPWPGTPWGYGPGWAWYRFLGGNRPDPESFEGAQRELAAFLGEVRTGLPVRTGQLVLGGFSQGGVMAMAYALCHPGEAPLVMNFSGFLADHPSVRPSPASVMGTRFFWGHGTQDPMIPFALAAEGRKLLRDAGADLTARDYPIGHGISPDEQRDARAWLQAALEE